VAASRSLLIYVVLSYVLPLLYYFFLYDGFNARYVISSVSIVILMANVFFVVLVIIVRFGRFTKSEKKIYISENWYFPFAVAFFSLSIYFFLSYDISFRHTSRLSDGGSLIYILYITRTLALYSILRVIIAITNGEVIRKHQKISVILVALGLLLTTTSSLQVLDFFMALFASVANTHTLNKRFNSISAIKMFIPALLLLSAVIYFGVANKVGFEAALVFFKEFGGELIKSSFLRVSTSFVSGGFSSLNSFQNYLDFSVFDKIYSTFIYRIQLVFPFIDFGINGEYLNTVNRMNYLNITKVPSLERAGASPGLIASFLYLPLYPVSLIIVGLYIKILISRVDCLLRSNTTPSIIVSICILIYFRPLLESPLSIFVIIDPVFFVFLILIVGSMFQGKNRKCLR
jgi:hypothetical protein